MPPRVIEGIEALQTLIGQELGVSNPVEVTQAHINAFADATGDHQWIHVDPERAKTSLPGGATIAHGFLTLSLLPKLALETFMVKGDFKMGVNYGFNRMRFPAPVPVGTRLRARFTLLGVEAVSGGFQIALGDTVESETLAKPALAAEWLVRYFV